MLLLCGQFKREIRHGVKLLWQATNHIQSRRTERMQFTCFVKAEKHSLLLKGSKQRCQEVWLDVPWLFTESLLVPLASVFLKNET